MTPNPGGEMRGEQSETGVNLPEQRVAAPAPCAHCIDPEQAVLDLQEAQDRLEQLRLAIARKDALEAEVSHLTQQLRGAKRRLKEAGWDLAALLSRERRKGGKR